ncbi:MAG: segregation/condensation protein A [Phycisphaerales bacterium]|nr:segregation/condensation protein A [Phycisphaerales bacterium]
MTTQDDYTVRLANFEGPLDLLLYLVRKSEVDITRISIAEIADQYIAFLDDIGRVNVDLAGEFLVTAATLLELKSRMLTPEQEQEEIARAVADVEADRISPGMELIQSLLRYRNYRDASDALEARRVEWLNRYPAGRAGISEERLDDLADQYADLELEEIELMDLVEAFQRIVETVQFDRLGEHSVHYDDTPIELHQADIVDRLEREGGRTGRASLSMREVFAGRHRSEMIGLFLAILELIRQRRVRASAEDSAASIRLDLRPAPDENADPAADWDDDHLFDDDEDAEDEYEHASEATP